jgi:pimeloyl-ACP methyl ester carboxylesterase
MKPKIHVIFLPGLLNDASLFRAQIAALLPVALTEVADLTQSESIAEMAASVIRQAPMDRFVLVGLSMGGYVALEIMRQAPDRVCGLALLDTSARPETPEATVARQALMKLAETDMEAVGEQMLPRLSHPDHVTQPGVRGVLHSMLTGLGKDVFLRQQTAIMGRADSRPGLAFITCPTLVIVGREDLITPPEVAEEITTHIRHAQFHIIDNCGHLSPLDQPEEVARLLLEWVSGLTY